MSSPDPRIQAYLNGTLTGDALEEFLDSARSDEALATALSEQVAVQAGRINLRKRLDAIHEQQEQSSGVSFGRRWQVAALAGLVAVAAVLAILFLTPSPDLFAEYYEPAPPLAITRGSDSPDLETTMVLYHDGNYNKALEGFEKMELDGMEDVLLFFRAQCLMAATESNDNRAIALLSEVVDSESPYADRARWYRSLALLRSGQIDAAKKDLTTLAGAGTSGYKSKEANELLNALD